MIISKKCFHYLSLSAGLASCLLLAACDSGSGTNASTHQVKSSNHRVDVTVVENKAVALTQTVSGTLEAVTKIRLYNEESGRITRLPYHEGDSVKKGQLLAQLDDDFLKLDVAEARASREQAELDLSRLKKLLPKKISTEEEVARARTELDLAAAEEKRQLTRLKRSNIKAPIDGLITRRLYEPGDMVAVQSHILSIIEPTALRLKADLAERWLPLVKKGQTVSLKIDALGDTEFNAQVARIHPTINTSTHKGTVEILLSPIPAGARVGQFSRAKIELTATNRLILPVHAIHYEPSGAYVFRVIEDEKQETVVEKVSFVQGQQFASVAEILSGLSAGDRIVSRGFMGLRTGKEVEVSSKNNLLSKTSNSKTVQNAVTEKVKKTQ